MKKYVMLVMVLVLLVGCSAKKPEETDNNGDNGTVIQANRGEYSIISPFKASPLRQIYATNYREVDMIEIGRRLQDKSKEYFDPAVYNISEGSVIDEEHYDQLLRRESKNYPYGLNPVQGTEFKADGHTIKDPVFVRDVVEVDFHTSTDGSVLSGVSIALVMKRIQTEDKTGLPVKLSDETMFEIARTSIGSRLISYLRTIDGLSDVPIMLAIYAQESDVDKIPGNYLPGNYLGHGFFESRGGQFEQDSEAWYLFNTQNTSTAFPEKSTEFSRFKRDIESFMGDESIGVVGRLFVSDSKIQNIDIDIITGSKTYLELDGLAKFAVQHLDVFTDLKAPLTINIKVYQNSRIIIQKEPGKQAVVIRLT